MTDACSTEFAEAALVERARTDAGAFGQLYESYLPRIYRYVYRRCGAHADTEDITARIFHRVLEHLPAYEARGLPFAAWLFRIAHNEVVTHYRRNGTRASLSLDGLGERAVSLADPAMHVDEALVRDEEADAAWTAVAALPPMQRRAVTLYFGHDMSHAEVGRAIGRSEAATKQLVYRAVKALRTTLVETREESAHAQSN